MRKPQTGQTSFDQFFFLHDLWDDLIWSGSAFYQMNNRRRKKLSQCSTYLGGVEYVEYTCSELLALFLLTQHLDVTQLAEVEISLLLEPLDWRLHLVQLKPSNTSHFLKCPFPHDPLCSVSYSTERTSSCSSCSRALVSADAFPSPAAPRLGAGAGLLAGAVRCVMFVLGAEEK